MRKFLTFIFLFGCFSIEETIWIKDVDSYDLLYTIYAPSFITQIVSEDSIINSINDDKIKWKKVETDTISGISKIEIFYENLNLNELIQKDSTMKFFKSKDYIEFYNNFLL